MLAMIAAAAPRPWWPTDSFVYEQMARDFIVPGCTDIHCFRVLVPWVLGRVPLPSPIAWKAYAVLFETAAALAMGVLAARFGATPRACLQIVWLTALGAGSLYTLFDPHTSDPLMHFLMPVVLLVALDDRIRPAATITAIGVFAKEIAVAPLAIAGIARALQHRYADAARALGWAAAAVALWIGWQIVMRAAVGYEFGVPGRNIRGGGGFLTFWLLVLAPTAWMSSLVMVLGVLWLLWPAGLRWAPRELGQLTFGAVPIILVFSAVQQPDRALWNFVFLVMPAAAMILQRVPAAMGWLLVALHGLANLRLGAQLPFVPPARVSFTLAVGVAIACIWTAYRQPMRVEVPA